MENYDVLCSCECGNMLPRFDIYGRPRQFINGHNARTMERSPNFSFKGKKHTKESKKKMSSALKKAYTSNPDLRKQRSKTHKNKKLSNETKNQISDSLKKHYASNPLAREKISAIAKTRVGSKNSFFGAKHTDEAKAKMSVARKGKWGGSKNPYWKGGTSFEPYTKTFHEIREKIRARDNYRCCVCDVTKNKNGRKLHVHHIDYNKKNDTKKNLITLCAPCHNKTFTNRDYWVKQLTKKIGDIYA